MRLTADLVTRIGAVITILVAVYGAYQKGKSDESERAIDDRRTRVEESRERVERYKFALATLTGLRGKDSTDRGISLAIARLALTDSEAGDLFRGLAASPDSSLSQLGHAGASQQEVLSLRDTATAARLERQGYEQIAKGEFADAAASFEGAERAFPTYHQAYELGRFLRRTRGLPSDSIRARVLRDYSRYARPAERGALSGQTVQP
ncbi:MAG TPA: hypothetical protein VKB91_03580 [Gemmatimonadaceae bacterium]|nr:hypothetical protein [Gemmatimonadaceae bacterium]